MLATPSPDTGISMLLIEGGLTVIKFAMAFALPRFGSAPHRFILVLINRKELQPHRAQESALRRDC
jgi:hypothetical protein